MPKQPLPEQSPDYRPEALRRIAEWKREGDLDAELDFHSLQLGTLPPELFELTKLRKLGLSLNRLTSLPPEIGRLRALRELLLDRNQLTMLPPELGQLPALTRLDLSGNQLTTLPPEIRQLTALPPVLGQLTALTELNLSDNPLPAELQALVDKDMHGRALLAYLRETAAAGAAARRFDGALPSLQ